MKYIITHFPTWNMANSFNYTTRYLIASVLFITYYSTTLIT